MVSISIFKVSSKEFVSFWGASGIDIYIRSKGSRNMTCKIKDYPLKDDISSELSELIAAYSYRQPAMVTEIRVYRDGTSFPICPKCDVSVDREYVNFCGYCGQRLNWCFLHRAKERKI